LVFVPQHVAESAHVVQRRIRRYLGKTRRTEPNGGFGDALDASLDGVAGLGVRAKP